MVYVDRNEFDTWVQVKDFLHAVESINAQSSTASEEIIVEQILRVPTRFTEAGEVIRPLHWVVVTRHPGERPVL